MNEKKYRIEVTLNDHQQEFIEWMAERGSSVIQRRTEDDILFAVA